MDILQRGEFLFLDAILQSGSSRTGTLSITRVQDSAMLIEGGVMLEVIVVLLR